MTDDTLKLTDQQVLEYSRRSSGASAGGGRGLEMFHSGPANVWLGVGVNCHSIESVCANLVGTADSETIRRRYLKKQLIAEDLPELEKCLNAALATEIPPRVCR